MHSDIDTPLYRLRLPRLTDAPAIFSNYASDPEVTRYMVWATHTAVETTEEFLAGAMEQNKSDEGWTWSIVEPGSDECIGMIGVIPEDHRAEIGYVLSRRFWGLGIMTEAVSSVLGWCFSIPKLYRVWATCAVENVASARVLAKAGMEREGILRGWHVFPNYSETPQDCYAYSILNVSN